MSKILDLMDKRAKAWDAAKKFLDTHSENGGMVSAEDAATYEKMEKEVTDLTKDIERLQTIIFLETTTNGIRRQVMERVCLPRRFEQVTTPWGEVSVKVATLPDGSERAAPEYEDCARLACEHGVPLQRVMQAAQAAALQFE